MAAPSRRWSASGNCLGAQFHPERSGEAGARFLEAFLAMLIYPAMDLMRRPLRAPRTGPVRRRHHLFRAIRPRRSPASPHAGAEWAHVVDLDGARARRAAAARSDRRACPQAPPIKLQVAGGFRDARADRPHVRCRRRAGRDRQPRGQRPRSGQRLLDEFGGDRITLALDVNLVDGESDGRDRRLDRSRRAAALWDVAALYPDARHLLVTDISRDGMMAGPNLALIAEAARRLPHLAVQASGGVASLDDLRALRDAGAAGAIVGKALWEGRIDLQKAIASARA